MSDNKAPQELSADALLAKAKADMRAAMLALMAKRDATSAELAPLRAKCDQVHRDIQALYDTIAPLGEQIKARMPEQQAVENEIARLAKALGGRAMSDV
jgi:uncharacterized coiled-coil DUF342 family protein